MRCEQCGKDTDLMLAFTKYQVCGDCTRYNHKHAMEPTINDLIKNQLEGVGSES
jgi:ribosome-binding protein aMBF1 (putative translation factor)